MKVQIILGIISFFGLFLSCNEEGLKSPSKGKTFSINESNNSQDISDSTSIVKGGLWENIPTFQPAIKLPSIYTLISGLDLNGENNAYPEQAIVASDSQENDTFFLLIVAYDEFKHTLGIVYRYPLSINVASSLTIKMEDITGDSENSILLEGFTKEGDSVLEVFKPSVYKNSRYSLIFKKALRGTISIERLERSPAYESGIETGLSFPINIQYEIFQKNKEIEIFQEKYQWNPKIFEYSLINSQSQIKNLNQQLFNYLKEGKEGVCKLLAGPWYKEETKQSSSFFFFNSKKEEVSFYTKDRQDVFKWQYASLPTPQSFYITVHNELIDTIRSNFRIHIIDLNTIEITSGSDDTIGLSGIFKRVSDTIKDSIFLKNKKDIQSERGFISYPEGFYIGEGGVKVEFQHPYVVFYEGNQRKEGVFEVFTFKNRNILQWDIRETNQTDTVESFSLTYLSQDSSDESEKQKYSIILQPIDLSYNKIYFKNIPETLRFDPLEQQKSSSSF